MGVSLCFFTNGLVATFLPRLPEVKATFGLGDGLYGFMVAGMGIGAIIAASFPAPFINRFGPRRVALVSTLLSAVGLATLGFAPNPIVFAGTLLAMGFLDSFADAAQNTHGVAVQQWSRHTIINSMHAVWSIGAAIAAFVGSLFAGGHVPLSIHTGVMTLGIAVIAVVSYTLSEIPIEAATSHVSDVPVGRIRTFLPLVPLMIIALCGVIPEDVTNNWSAYALVSEFEVSHSAAGMALTLMLVAQTAGRLGSDSVTDRLGERSVMVLGCLVVAAGSLAVACSPVAWLAYVGFALMGVGSAPLVPTAYAVAGRLPGVPSGTGISLIGFALRFGIAGSSPLIGIIAETAGLRFGIAIPAVAGTVAAIAATSLSGPRETRYGAGEEV